MEISSIKNNNDVFLDNHFDKKRLKTLYSSDTSYLDIDDDYAAKLAAEVWLELKGYNLPDTVSFQERISIFKTFWPEVLLSRKSKLPFSFYKKFDVSDLRNEISNLDEGYWNINKDSVEKDPIYKNTNILGNTLFPIFYDGSQQLNVIKNNYLPKNIQKKTDEIVSELEYEFNGKVLISGYTRLKAGKQIPPHVDDLYYFKVVNRFQIAISTNSKVYFNIEKETKIFEEGDCYSINNLLRHSIINDGETDRINLIVDILSWNKINSRYSLIQWKNNDGR